MSSSKKAFHNSISSLIYYGVVLVFGLVLPRLYLGTFGSAVNGLNSTLQQIFSCLSLLEAGVGLASQQAYYRPVAENDRDKVNSILAATRNYYHRTGIIYAVITAVLGLTYPLCVDSKLSYITICLMIFLYGIPGVISYLVQGKYRSFLDANGESYVVTYLTAGSTVVGNLLRIAALLWFGNILLVQATYLAPTALQLIVILAYIHRKYPWMTANVTPDSSALGQKNSVLVHQIAETVFNNTDTILISSLCSLAAASVYSIYSVFFSNLQKIFDSFVISISFKLGQMFQTERTKFDAAFRVYVLMVYIAAFGGFTAVSLFILPVIQAYTDGVTDTNYIRPDVAVLFAVVVILSCVKRPWYNLITYSGTFRETRHQAIIETVLNVAISIVAAHKLGISGCLIGTICALSYRIVVTILYVYKNIFRASPTHMLLTIAVNLCVSIIIMRIVGLSTCDGENIIMVLLTGCGYGIVSLIIFTILNAALNPNVVRSGIRLARKNMA